MPVTDAQRKALLAAGYSPDWYNQSPDAEPSLSPPIAKVESSSALGAGARSFGANVAPTVAGGAGFGAGQVLGTSLAALLEGAGVLSDATGAGAIIGIPLGIAGAALMANMAQKKQEKLLPDSVKQQLAQDALEHPLATKGGALAALPLGGLNPNAPNVIRAGGALAKLPAGLPLARSEAQNLANVGIGAALNPAISAGTALAQGQPLPSAGELGESALTGALFNKPNIIGRAYGFHPSPEIARNAAAVPNAPFQDVTPAIVQATQTLAEPDVSGVGMRTRVPQAGEMSQLIALAQGLPDTGAPSGSALNNPLAVFNRVAPQSGMKAPEKAAIVEALKDRSAIQHAQEMIPGNAPITAGREEQVVPTPEKRETQSTQFDIDRQLAEAESLANNPALPLSTKIAAQEQLNKLRTQTRDVGAIPAQPQQEPLIKPAESVSKSPKEAKIPLPGTSGNEPPGEAVQTTPSKTPAGFLTSKVPAETALEKAMNRTSKFQPAKKEEPQAPKGKIFKASTQLDSPQVQSRLSALAAQHGVKIGIDRSIPPEAAGEIFRNGAQDTLARLNPDTARIDTPHHEILHALFSYMKSCKSKALAKFAAKGEALFNGEEPFVQMSGESGAKRFFQSPGWKASFKEWLGDFKSFWKYRLGKATPEDMARIMSYYEVHDTGTHERYGGQGGARVNQDTSHLPYGFWISPQGEFLPVKHEQHNPEALRIIGEKFPGQHVEPKETDADYFSRTPSKFLSTQKGYVRGIFHRPSQTLELEPGENITPRLRKAIKDFAIENGITAKAYTKEGFGRPDYIHEPSSRQQPTQLPSFPGTLREKEMERIASRINNRPKNLPYTPEEMSMIDRYQELRNQISLEDETGAREGVMYEQPGNPKYQASEKATEGKPIAPVKYLGEQPGFAHLPAQKLYNLTEDHPQLGVRGSTISERTLREKGFEVPPSGASKFQPSNAAKEEEPRSPFTTSLEKELAKPKPFGNALSKEGTMPSGEGFKEKIERFVGKDEYAALREAGLEDYLKGKTRVSAKELRDWVKENGPKVTVRKFGQGALDEPTREFNKLTHEWYDNFPEVIQNAIDEHQPESVIKELAKEHGYENNPYLTGKDFYDKYSRYKELEGRKNYNTENQSHWQQIASKPENEMKGYTEIAVVKPASKFRRVNPKYATGLPEETGHKFSESHNFPPNTLAWVRGHMEERPSGKTFFIDEIQSDWAQRLRDAKEREANPDSRIANADLENVKRLQDPLLAHHERLALKAAIEHARSEGATHITIADPETAMMTEGHDRVVESPETRYVQVRNKEGEWENMTAVGVHNPRLTEIANDYADQYGTENVRVITPTRHAEPSQAPGMRLHYGKILPDIARDITGDRGTRESFGEHKMAFETKRASPFETPRPGEEGYEDYVRRGHNQMMREPRKNLIFKNPDGTPKTDASGITFDISKVASRREQGEPFTPFGAKFQSASQTRPEDVVLGMNNKDRFSGDLTKEEKLPYLSLPGFRPLLDVVRARGGTMGNRVADAVEKFYINERTERGKWDDARRAVGALSRQEREQLYRTLLAERRSQESYREELPSDKQKEAYDTLREALKRKQVEQQAAGEPVIDFRGKIPVARPAKIDPYYMFNTPSAKALDVMLNHPETGDAHTLKQDFLNYNISRGLKPDAAQEKLDQFLSAFGGREHPSQNRFGANRIAEGVGLPDSWIEPDLNKALERYTKRVAKDRAWFDAVESQPDINKALGATKDAWLKPIQSEAPNISSMEEVKRLLENIKGGKHEEINANAAARVATALTLGPLTAIHIAGTAPFGLATFARPEELPGLLKSYGKALEGIKHGFQQGYIHRDVTYGREFLEANTEFADKANSLARLITKISGREHLDYFTKGLLQAGSEFLVKNNIARAAQGDARSIDFIKNLDPTLDLSREVPSQNRVQELATTLASFIHGDYTAKTMPSWLLTDGFVAPFFKLSSWNIGQTNHFMRNVLTPATKGNYIPLIMNIAGTVLGGALVKYLRETVADKKSPIPSLTEIAKSPEGLEGNIPLVGYNLMAMASYGGFMGMLSQAAKTGFDFAYKNKPQGAMFPLDETVSNFATQFSNIASALVNGDMDYKEAIPRMLSDMLRNNIQMGRIGLNWLGESGMSELEKQRVSQSKYSRDLRAFEMIHHYPYDQQTVDTSNPYLEPRIRQFKKTEDLQEAVGMLPSIIQREFDRSHGDINIFRQRLQGLKNNPLTMVPNLESNPIEFMRYVQFIRNTQGDDAAGKLLGDYYRKRTINQVKSSLVP